MAKISKLSNQEFLRTMINMLRVVVEKVDNIQEQMGHVSIKTEILKIKNMRN